MVTGAFSGPIDGPTADVDRRLLERDLDFRLALETVEDLARRVPEFLVGEERDDVGLLLIERTASHSRGVLIVELLGVRLAGLGSRLVHVLLQPGVLGRALLLGFGGDEARLDQHLVELPLAELEHVRAKFMTELTELRGDFPVDVLESDRVAVDRGDDRAGAEIRPRFR